MSEPAEILCSRCGTPFPKEKGKTAVTCVVCGQLRPDLDLTLDDDDDDLGAALGGGAGGGAVTSRSGAFSPGMGGGSAGSIGNVASAGGGESTSSATSTMDSETPVLRVAGTASGGGMDSAPAPKRNAQFRIDHPYMPMSDGPAAFGDTGGRPLATGDRLLERVGPVLLVVCPLIAGMAGALNMMQRTEDFSLGTWYAVGTVFAMMAAGAALAGLMVAGVLYLVRLRWTVLLRLVFIAAAGAVCYYGMNEVPSHIQVRPDGLPGFVVRK